MEYKTEYGKGQIVYFASGNSVMKAVIDEVFVHDTVNDGVITKYCCRPYGISPEHSLSVTADAFYLTFEEAVPVVQQLMAERFELDKANRDNKVEKLIEGLKRTKIDITQEEAEKIIDRTIETNRQKDLETFEKSTDAEMDRLEVEYQESLKQIEGDNDAK